MLRTLLPLIIIVGVLFHLWSAAPSDPHWLVQRKLTVANQSNDAIAGLYVAADGGSEIARANIDPFSLLARWIGGGENRQEVVGKGRWIAVSGVSRADSIANGQDKAIHVVAQGGTCRIDVRAAFEDKGKFKFEDRAAFFCRHGAPGPDVTFSGDSLSDEFKGQLVAAVPAPK